MTDIERLTTALADRYDIEREIGAGGMATVYLALDRKHDRHVAVKVLRPELAAVLGAERFLLEIKTTANLQHPHILPLFDSGRSGSQADGRTDEFLYYVMPYIEGETLRDKLDRETQLGVEEAVAIASDVADALDYAHRHDVIHRDIKPENILLHDGRPIVADFGIALAVSAAGGGRMTETGLSLGTPHYMSPEQATAEKDLTARSDVYSLGCVLYEMLTGDPPHTGAAAQAVIMRILTEEPRSISDVRRSVPPNVSGAVMKSLQKLPADRFHSAAAFHKALADSTFSYQSSVLSTAQVFSGSRVPGFGSWLADGRSKLVLALVGVLVMALVWAMASGAPANSTSGDNTVTRFAVDLGNISEPGGIAVSPDGSMLVLSGQSPGGPRLLFRRRSDQLEFEPIPDTRQSHSPVFSPDGEWIAFVTDQEIRQVPAGGGRASSIVKHAAPISSVHWGQDGTMVFASDRGLLWRVPPDGGDPERILETGEISGVFWPRMLPNGRSVLFTKIKPDRIGHEIRLLDLASGVSRTLLSDASDARFLDPGWLLYATPGQALFAVPFDPGKGEIMGAPVPVLDQVTVDPESGGARFAMADNGTVLYLTGDMKPLTQRTLVEVDGRGNEVSLRLPTRAYYGVPRWSPDGQRLTWQQDVGDIWVYDRVTGSRDLIASGGGHYNPIWMHDGSAVIYGTRAHDSTVIYRQSLDLTRGPEVLLVRPVRDFALPWSVSVDGRYLAYGTGALDAQDLWLFDLSTKESTAYLRADWAEVALDISPNGRWAAYESSEEGRTEIFVRAFPDPGEAFKVSTSGGIGARWAADGKRLYYRNADTVWVVSVRAEDDFEILSQEVQYVGLNIGLDPHPDGEHFVVAKPVVPDEEQSSSLEPLRLFMVVNWLAELEQRLGQTNE